MDSIYCIPGPPAIVRRSQALCFAKRAMNYIPLELGVDQFIWGRSKGATMLLWRRGDGVGMASKRRNQMNCMS